MLETLIFMNLITFSNCEPSLIIPEQPQHTNYYILGSIFTFGLIILVIVLRKGDGPPGGFGQDTLSSLDSGSAFDSVTSNTVGLESLVSNSVAIETLVKVAPIISSALVTSTPRIASPTVYPYIADHPLVAAYLAKEASIPRFTENGDRVVRYVEVYPKKLFNSWHPALEELKEECAQIGDVSVISRVLEFDPIMNEYIRPNMNPYGCKWETIIPNEIVDLIAGSFEPGSKIPPEIYYFLTYDQLRFIYTHWGWFGTTFDHLVCAI